MPLHNKTAQVERSITPGQDERAMSKQIFERA